MTINSETEEHVINFEPQTTNPITVSTYSISGVSEGDPVSVENNKYTCPGNTVLFIKSDSPCQVNYPQFNNADSDIFGCDHQFEKFNYAFYSFSNWINFYSKYLFSYNAG